jgi:hypothetical protein
MHLAETGAVRDARQLESLRRGVPEWLWVEMSAVIYLGWEKKRTGTVKAAGNPYWRCVYDDENRDDTLAIDGTTLQKSPDMQ